MFHWSKIYDEIQGQENRGCQRGRHKPGIKEKPRRNGVGMGMRCRIKSRLCAVPAAMGFLTAVCLLATLPRAAVFARELIDTGKECSLTVKTEILVQDVEGENADWRELNERDIQVYLYRVADVDQYGEYTGIKGFEELELEKIDDAVKADDWREMARAAANILGLPIPPRAEGAAADGNTDGDANTAHQSFAGTNRTALAEAIELPGDLPDKLARADAEITVENGTGTMQGLAQGMYLVWVMPVETDSCQYTFLPYLVSLPNNSYDAAVPGSVDEWEYETAVGLKPRQNLLYGGLRIRKRLDTYNGALGEAMFVFLVEARKDLDHDGEKEIVYSNVVGLEFDASGTKEAVIEHIPAGSEVTVEEIYSGSAYTVQGSARKEVTVWAGDGNGAGDMPAVEFTNDYDNRVTYGTGAVNHFTHDGDGWLGNRMPGSKGGGGE